MSVQHRSPQARPAKGHRERAVAALVDLAYPTPNPVTDEAAAAIFTHQDLRDLSPAELRKEEFRVRLAVSLHPRPPAWFAEREHMIALELLARATSGGQS